MRTNTGSIAAVLLGAALLLHPSSAKAADVTTLLSEMRQALAPGRDMRADVAFIMTNARGETVRWTGQYSRRSGPGAVSRFVFHAPLDIRGIEVTVSRTPKKVDTTRVYLPSLRRTRIIEADMRGESFLGTDFNYEDLGLEELEFQQHTLVAEAKIEGRRCHRVDSIPQGGWWYGKIVRFIDRKNHLPLRTEYYDKSGVLHKVRTMDDVKKIQGYNTPMTVTMETQPLDTATRIEFSSVAYDTGALAEVSESR